MRPGAARAARDARPRRLAAPTATRSRRAGCRSRCWTPPRSSVASRSGSSRAGAASSRPTAASSSPTSRCRRCWHRPWRPARRSASTLRVDSVDEDGDGVVAGERARAGRGRHRRRLGAGARGRRRHPDARDDVLLLPRRAGAVRDRAERRQRTRLRARGAGHRHEGGLAPVGADRRSGRAGRAGRGDRGADGGLGGTAIPRGRSGRARRDLPLHEEGERRVPPRTPRADRRRLAVQRPRLQVRAADRAAARRARARSAL